jgi:hypothetical protein
MNFFARPLLAFACMAAFCPLAADGAEGEAAKIKFGLMVSYAMPMNNLKTFGDRFGDGDAADLGGSVNNVGDGGGIGIFAEKRFSHSIGGRLRAEHIVFSNWSFGKTKDGEAAMDIRANCSGAMLDFIYGELDDELYLAMGAGAMKLNIDGNFQASAPLHEGGAPDGSYHSATKFAWAIGLGYSATKHIGLGAKYIAIMASYGGKLTIGIFQWALLYRF